MKRLVLLVMMIAFGLVNGVPAADFRDAWVPLSDPAAFRDIPKEEEAFLTDVVWRCDSDAPLQSEEDLRWCKEVTGSAFYKLGRSKLPTLPATSPLGPPGQGLSEPQLIDSVEHLLFDLSYWNYSARRGACHTIAIKQDPAGCYPYILGFDIVRRRLDSRVRFLLSRFERQARVSQAAEQGWQTTARNLECKEGFLQGYDPRGENAWMVSCPNPLPAELASLRCVMWGADDFLAKFKVTKEDITAGRIRFVQCLTPEASEQWRRYINKFGAAVADVALSSDLNQVERDARIQGRQLTTDTLLFLQQLNQQFNQQMQFNELQRQQLQQQQQLQQLQQPR